MPIVNHNITATGSGSDTTSELERYGAVQQIIDGIFSDIISVLSADGFTRVDQNTLEYGQNTLNYLYRETYKLGDNDKKYLIVELSNLSNLGKGGAAYDTMSISLLIVDQIAASGGSGVDATYSNRVNIIATSNTSNTVVDNVTTYYCDISLSAYLLNVKNESLSLYTIAKDTAKTNLFNSVGWCTVNDNEYLAWQSGGNSTLQGGIALEDANGAIKYTNSIMIATNTGTSDTGYILTLPVYLSDTFSATAVIYKDLKLENTLQTTNNACSYGGIYKIGGVDYFAISNNFLIKL